MSEKENGVISVVEEKDADVIKRICDRTAMDLRTRGLTTKNNPIYATITQAFIEATIAKLLEMKKEKSSGGQDYDVSINLFDFIKMGIERETYEDDENDGNIVPFIEPGIAFTEMIKNNKRPEDEIGIEEVEEEDIK